MEIYPIGKTESANNLIKKLAQQLNINNTNKIEFPFEFSTTSDETQFNYPADKIGGFVNIKNLLDIPNEIYVNINDAKAIGAFTLNLLT